MNIFGLILLVLGLWLVPMVSMAHCPLCTAGAGIAAIGASALGIGSGSIGVFIGAFGLAIGLWIGKLIKKNYIPYQKWLVGIGSFFLTVIPMMPLFPEGLPIDVAIAGEYGGLLHRVYAPNVFLLGSILGALLLIVSPWISKKIREKRGKQFACQGLAITFILLLLGAVLMELWV